MNRVTIVSLSLACLLGVVAGVLPAGAAEPLRIVAATTDLGAIARAVTGDDAVIEIVARPDRDLHSLEVRPSTMRLAAKADFYLEVGLMLDLWSADIVRGSRNRDLVVIDCSQAIAPLEVPQGKVDASMGDVHPQGNPHWWLDPANGAKVAHLLADRFAAARPDRADTFRKNAATFAADLAARTPAWKSRMQGRAFMEFHRTWSYFVAAFGARIEGRVEPLPGIPPSARHLADLANLIRTKRVPVVIRDVYHPNGPLEFLARETGVRTAVLAAACDEPTPASYIARFDQAVSVLGTASAGGPP
jgi:zinc/manganese transport system substrate-binding protein